MQMPYPNTFYQYSDECDAKCKHKADDDCCSSDCLYEVTRTYVNGKLYKENFINNYEDSVKAQSEKEAWRLVFERSFEACIELCTFLIELNFT